MYKRQLPICGGGCANRRLRAKHFGEQGLTYCSPYKEHLTAYLEEYYDTYLSRALLGVGLPPHDAAQADRGYRMVHPQKRCAAEEPHPPWPTPSVRSAEAGKESPSVQGSGQAGAHDVTGIKRVARGEDED